MEKSMKKKEKHLFELDPEDEAGQLRREVLRRKGGIVFGKYRPRELFFPWLTCPDRLPENRVKDFLLPKQPEAKCWEVIRHDAWGLECILHPTEDMCIEAVSQDGLVLYFVEVQTDAICHAAVKNNPEALQFVFHQTELLAKVAVRKNGLALSLVDNACKTREVCLEAVKENGMALEFVPKKMRDREMCETAIRQFPLAIMHCPKQSEELKRIALEDSVMQMECYFTGLVNL